MCGPGYDGDYSSSYYYSNQDSTKEKLDKIGQVLKKNSYYLNKTDDKVFKLLDFGINSLTIRIFDENENQAREDAYSFYDEDVSNFPNIYKEITDEAELAGLVLLGV